MQQVDNKLNLKIFLFPLITILFLIFFFGCETVKTKYVGADSVNINYANDTENAVVKITGLILKNGKTLDLRDKNPEVYINENSKEIYYDVSDDNRSNIPFDEISLFRIEIVKSRNLTTVIILSSAFAVIMVLLVSLLNFRVE